MCEGGGWNQRVSLSLEHSPNGAGVEPWPRISEPGALTVGKKSDAKRKLQRRMWDFGPGSEAFTQLGMQSVKQGVGGQER